MGRPLAEFVQVPGVAASGAVVPEAVRDRYITSDEARFWRKVVPYMDLAWEADRNRGVDCIPPYAGAATDQFDAITGGVFTGADAVFVDTDGGPTVTNFRALEPGGDNTKILVAPNIDICPIGQHFTYLVVVEFDTLPAAGGAIIGGSNFAVPLTRHFKAWCTTDGKFRVENHGAGDKVTMNSAIAAGRRDLLWFAWHEDSKGAGIGRRNATPAVTGTWTTSFDPTTSGEQIGCCNNETDAMNAGRILARFRCHSTMTNDAGFQSFLDDIAEHYGCAD
jgi:hypothetical protein